MNSPGGTKKFSKILKVTKMKKLIINKERLKRCDYVLQSLRTEL